MDNKCTILVAGDIVWDTHLYVAPLDDLRPEQAQPTFHGRHRGGAALTWKLLRATAEAQVELKAKALEAKAQAEKKAETTQQEKDMAKAQLEEDKKRAAYPIALAPAATRGNADGTATQTVLTSYGVWTPQPARAQRKDQVWRVSTQGGYGPLPGWESAYSDKADTDATGQADGTEPVR